MPTNDSSSADVQPREYEIYSLIAWSVIAGTMLLIGNFIVLVADLKYHAIKLDKISVALMRNLAVADIGFTVFWIFLGIGTLIKEKCVYGDPYSVVIEILSFVCGGADMTLICALNISKLLTLMFPLQARLRTSRTGHIIASVIWVFWIVYHGGYTLFADNYSAVFVQYVLQCGASFQFNELRNNLLGGIMSLLTLILTVTTLWLLFYIGKVRGLQSQIVLTVVTVSTVYFLSYLPIMIATPLDVSIANEWSWWLYYKRFSSYIMYTNYAANPVIYFYTIRSFGEFVRDKLLNRLNLFCSRPVVQVEIIQNNTQHLDTTL